MKKFLVLLLAIVYLGVSSGATLHLHYCMGKLVNMGLSTQNEDACGKCGMTKKEKNGCCQDEQKQLKTDQAQKTQAEFSFSFLALEPIFLSEVIISEPQFSSVNEENPTSNAPPRTQSVSLYIQNCTFLI